VRLGNLELVNQTGSSDYFSFRIGDTAYPDSGASFYTDGKARDVWSKNREVAAAIRRAREA
jgi:hypothetical protein